MHSSQSRSCVSHVFDVLFDIQVKRVQPAGEDSAVFDIYDSRRTQSRKSSTYSATDLSSTGSFHAGDEIGSKAQSFANASNKEDSCSGVKRVDSLAEPIIKSRGTKVMNMVDLAEVCFPSLTSTPPLPSDDAARRSVFPNHAKRIFIYKQIYYNEYYILLLFT